MSDWVRVCRAIKKVHLAGPTDTGHPDTEVERGWGRSEHFTQDLVTTKRHSTSRNSDDNRDNNHNFPEESHNKRINKFTIFCNFCSAQVVFWTQMTQRVPQQWRPSDKLRQTRTINGDLGLDRPNLQLCVCACVWEESQRLHWLTVNLWARPLSTGVLVGGADGVSDVRKWLPQKKQRRRFQFVYYFQEKWLQYALRV